MSSKGVYLYVAGVVFLLGTAGVFAQDQPSPGIVTIESNVLVSPPGWAVLERQLLDINSRAAMDFATRHTRTGGTLIWKTKGSASEDDLQECFYNFPLLYALGGDARLRDLSFNLYHAAHRQLTNDFDVLYRDFAKHDDWFHIGEGLQHFYYLALADPTDHEIANLAQQFAGFYMNEDATAPNYDPKLHIIRSPHSGSQGPAPTPALSSGQITAAQQQRVNRDRGDVVANLAATSLATHAYLFTGEQKYADWVKEYAGEWLDLTRANGGITPDNIGLSGKVGEYYGGNWWGGNYGWQGPHGFYSVGEALAVGAANATLVSNGDPRYSELLRSNIKQLISLGKDVNGTFLVPYKKGDQGWFAYQPLAPQYLAALWCMSMLPEDWALIERVRLANKQDWHIATKSPFPNRGHATLPEASDQCWYCDIEGLADWNRVVDSRNKEDRSHEGPWLRFLAGANPEYPERILSSSLGIVAWRLDQIRRNMLLLEYDSRKTEAVHPKDLDLTKVHEHYWQTVNPVTTEALIQLTTGAPQIMYNGGLLYARVRYFDPAGRRPGLPEDVAALVRKLEADQTELELVNLNPFEARDVIVQAGTFGEDEFTRVRFQERVDREPPQPEQDTRPIPKLAERVVTINHKFFQAHLPPGSGLNLQMGIRRFVNKPSYAFPWK